MKVFRDIAISEYLTVGVGGRVKYFISVHSEGEIKEACQWARENGVPFIVLAGGSNLIFGEYFNGLVIKIENRGFNVRARNDSDVEIEVSAGENLDDFINYTVEEGLWGLENLSLIPGTVGATPVQNVGAFGQSVSNIIKEVRCYDSVSEEIITLNRILCNFSHRTSIFNQLGGERYIILSVCFVLTSDARPILHREQLAGLRCRDRRDRALQMEIRESVIKYRTNGKNLPVGERLGTAGTFFQTALVTGYREFFRVLFRSAVRMNPKVSLLILLYALKYRSKHGYRIPSRILIEASGLASLRVGGIFLLQSNPSVLVVDREFNPKHSDMLNVISRVLSTVYYNTGVKIPIEPRLISLNIDRSYEFGS